MKGEVVVLRYGHRAVRDARITSHCCLVARAFGAKKIIVEGFEDSELADTVESINKSWGGGIELEFAEHWKPVLQKYRKLGFKAVHTTMYGVPLEDNIAKIRTWEKVLLIIGSQKVEREVYEMADMNISVTQQPHSEVAALAIFLHEYYGGAELKKKFTGAKLSITPQQRGKKVLSKKSN